MATAVFDSFSSLETVSLIILSNITSNKVFWEYVFNECFLTVPGTFYVHMAVFQVWQCSTRIIFPLSKKTSPEKTLLTKDTPIQP